MQAQACGCIPVTSGQPISAAPETCGDFDLGAKGRVGYIGQDAQWQQDYVSALLAAATRPASELAVLRTRMKASARARFNWTTVAAQWTDVFRNASAIAPAIVHKQAEELAAKWAAREREAAGQRLADGETDVGDDEPARKVLLMSSRSSSSAAPSADPSAAGDEEVVRSQPSTSSSSPPPALPKQPPSPTSSPRPAPPKPPRAKPSKPSVPANRPAKSSKPAKPANNKPSKPVFLEVGLESSTESAGAGGSIGKSEVDGDDEERRAEEAAQRLAQLRAEIDEQRETRRALERRVDSLTADAEACERGKAR